MDDEEKTFIVAAEVIELVEAEDPTLYCNRSYQPHIRITGDLFDRPWPVNSPRTKAWIAELCQPYLPIKAGSKILYLIGKYGWQTARRRNSATHLPKTVK